MINPENLTLQAWYIGSNFLYLASLISTSLIIAFGMRFLQHLYEIECFFDFIMAIDIILVFFTAVELPPTRWKTNLKKQHDTKDLNVFTRYEYNMIKIAKTYLFKFLIFDLLACLPTLLTLNKRRGLYYLKIFKFTQTIRIYDQIKIFQTVLIKRFQHHQLTIVNLTTVLRAAIALGLLLHGVTCGWILISLTNPKSWLFTKHELTSGIHMGLEYEYDDTPFDADLHEEYLEETLGKDWSKLLPYVGNIYATCFYFTTTTMTAVGYGDIKGWTELERLYLIAVAFSSLFLVSVIRSSVLNLL